jgi:hypothetical protein
MILCVATANAAVTVTVNGSNHTIPQTNEKGWGANVTAWIQAISANTLQPSGGTFSLTADANFGSSFGLVSGYYKSRTSNISSAGVLRLANSDAIGWRNNANGGNLLLSVDSSDRLLFNGALLPTLAASDFTDSGFTVSDNGDATKKLAFQVSGVTTATTRTLTVPDESGTMVLVNATQTLTNKTLDAGSNTITGLVKADVGLGNVDNTSDATKNAASVTLTNKSIDADSNTLSNIENADIKAAAAIAVNKLAAVTVSRVLVSDGSGFISPSSVTATEVGYLSGVTSSIQTQINSALTNPMTTGGDLIYGGASGVPTRLANGTSGQVPMSAGGTSAPTWATLPGNATALRSPTIQKFTATGTITGYYFTVSSANATVGATYTNNGNTFTVLSTIAAGTTLYTSGASAPQASGTLTKSAGTGDATITFSSAQGMATYALPTNPSPLFLKVSIVGGGAGGTGSGTSAGTVPTAGLPSLFGTALLVAGGGGVGSWGASGGAGGAATITAPAIGFSFVGGQGESGGAAAATGYRFPGGTGGHAPLFGGGGANAYYSVAGSAGQTNTGGGGQGGGNNATTNNVAGSGGGSGGFVGATIASPSSTYFYAVGTGGTAGGAGAGSGVVGGAGAAGILIVEEHYQ